MVRPLPDNLPPKVDGRMRERNKSVLQASKDLEFPNLSNWFPSSKTKMAAYVALAKAAKISLKQMYLMISAGQGAEVLARAMKHEEVTQVGALALKLGISDGLPKRISRNVTECATLEKAHRIAEYLDLEIEDLLERPSKAS